jgi:hypothetical protein
MTEPSTPSKPKFDRKDLVRYQFGHPARKIPIVVFLVLALQCVFFLIEQGITQSWNPVVNGLIMGVLTWVVPTGPLIVLLILKRRALHVMLIVYGTVFFLAVLTFAVLGVDFFGVGGFVGWIIGMLIAVFAAPKHVVFHYGRCPGCKYNLALLPKSDVCPECGRDNGDLKWAFAKFNDGNFTE